MVTDLDVAGKKVLVRVDFNVPIKEGKIKDDTRITSALPTINYLLEHGAAVILMSHLGRPKGQPNLDYSMRPVAEHLAALISAPVKFAEDCRGEIAKAAAAALKPGEVLVLENTRFYAEEEKNDAEFAGKISAGFDVFVMDAFSASHRAHASTRAVAEILPSFCGKLILREIEMLSAARDNPKKPFVLILGGAKVSDKIAVVENLMTKVDTILIGGGMAFTFLKAKGFEIGTSLCETDKLDFAAEMLKKAEALGVKIILPSDITAADEFKADAPYVITASDSIPSGKQGLDIGPKTAAEFSNIINEAKTVLWNGPMGVFEMDAFSKGTISVASAMASATKEGALTVVGGGDSAAAIAKFGFEDKVSHVSTGGGASLEFFEGKMLPGIEPYVI